jgi:hypothetical protein
VLDFFFRRARAGAQHRFMPLFYSGATGSGE